MAVAVTLADGSPHTLNAVCDYFVGAIMGQLRRKMISLVSIKKKMLDSKSIIVGYTFACR